MATNKHAIIRYQALDRCFSNTMRKYFIDDLIDACNKAIFQFSGNEIGIKRRQVLEDIKFMESPQGWNISLNRLREGHRVYYRYENQQYSINNQQLNEAEQLQLKEALLTLSRFKGLPQFEWVSEITTRLDAGFGLSSTNKKIIEFEQNCYLKGLEFITPIYFAIINKQVLSIKYKSFKSELIQTIVLHPYFLKQYNSRWYLYGTNDLNKFLLNLALDRISSINESRIAYIANDTIDFNEYFDNIIGVTIINDAAIEKVELVISNDLYPYIETKPVHGSQKVKVKESTHAILTLELIPNYELESLILSHGEKIQVKAPQSLKEKIKERLNKAVNNAE